MNIDEANPNELKRYIKLQLLRCSAIAEYIFYSDLEKSREEKFIPYVGTIAEMVEASCSSQVALARLIAIEGRDADQYVSEETSEGNWDDNFDNQTFKELKAIFMQRIHYVFGSSHSLANNFSRIVSDEDANLSKVYAGLRQKLAQINEATLLSQIAFSQILRTANREKS